MLKLYPFFHRPSPQLSRSIDPSPSRSIPMPQKPQTASPLPSQIQPIPSSPPQTSMQTMQKIAGDPLDLSSSDITLFASAIVRWGLPRILSGRPLQVLHFFLAPQFFHTSTPTLPSNLTRFCLASGFAAQATLGLQPLSLSQTVGFFGPAFAGSFFLPDDWRTPTQEWLARLLLLEGMNLAFEKISSMLSSASGNPAPPKKDLPPPPSRPLPEQAKRFAFAFANSLYAPAPLRTAMQAYLTFQQTKQALRGIHTALSQIGTGDSLKIGRNLVVHTSNIGISCFNLFASISVTLLEAPYYYGMGLSLFKPQEEVKQLLESQCPGYAGVKSPAPFDADETCPSPQKIKETLPYYSPKLQHLTKPLQTWAKNGCPSHQRAALQAAAFTAMPIYRFEQENIGDLQKTLPFLFPPEKTWISQLITNSSKYMYENFVLVQKAYETSNVIQRIFAEGTSPQLLCAPLPSK